MKKNNILILGGYGGVGRRMARLLLEETKADIIISGRRKEKSDAFAEELNREFPKNRVTSRYANVTDTSPLKGQSLRDAFKGVQLVIVLTTTPESIKQIAQAALDCGSDYLDILVSESTVHDLENLAVSIQKKKRTFITQAGFHPGLPAAFVRYGAQYFDTYEKAIIGVAMNARFERAEQAVEIIAMVSELRAEFYKEGSWRLATYKDVITLNMGNRFGTQKLFPMQMVEIKRTRDMFNLKETGVYVCGFNWFVDNLIFPLIWIAQKIKKGLGTSVLTRLFVWGVNTFSDKDQGIAFLNEAEGLKNGKKIKVRIIAEHDDAYLFTAIPVVACIKQYLDGKLPKGLNMMGHAVDVKKLFSQMQKMGVKIQVEKTSS